MYCKKDTSPNDVNWPFFSKDFTGKIVKNIVKDNYKQISCVVYNICCNDSK